MSNTGRTSVNLDRGARGHGERRMLSDERVIIVEANTGAADYRGQRGMMKDAWDGAEMAGTMAGALARRWRAGGRGDGRREGVEMAGGMAFIPPAIGPMPPSCWTGLALIAPPKLGGALMGVCGSCMPSGGALRRGVPCMLYRVSYQQPYSHQ